MEKCNVLLLGNSGVGKSTLINSVLGENKAKTGWGTKGTTTELEIYENDKVPFRLIDSVGFEPSFIKAQLAIKGIQKWSKDSSKEGKEDTQINVIWFCVEGTTSKLFPETIKNLTRAVKIYKSVPVVVVITKSYSLLERTKNIEMVNNAFAATKHTINLKKVIPVVAEQYVIDDKTHVPVEGVSELIDLTNDLLPEGKRAAKKDIADYILNRKRVFAHGTTTLATTAAVLECALPIPLADGLMLQPTELVEINALASIYEIGKDEKSNNFKNSIIDVGTVGTVAQGIISAIKAIPGINIAGVVLNSIVGGSIVAALGEGSIYVFEQIYLGNKTVDDIDWMKKIMESEYGSKVASKLKEIIDKLPENANSKDVAKIIEEVLSGIFN